MLFRRIFGTAALVLPILSAPAMGASVSLSIDNDGALGTDREYTSGLFLKWSSNPATIGYSLEIGSQIWTPTDIEWTTPRPNERPYAGLLYVQGSVYHQTDYSAYKANLMLGAVGPDSHAEGAQSIVHDIVGSPDPKGWDYQIDNQPVYQASVEAHRLLSRNALGEFSLFGRGQGGNFQSEVAVGGTYRIGWDLGNTFGATSVQAGNNIDVGMLAHSSGGAFFFTTLEGRYRFDDLTIEGDKPAQNDDLRIKNEQFAASAGFAWYANSWGVAASVTAVSKQFEQARKDHHAHGNLTLFYRY